MTISSNNLIRTFFFTFALAAAVPSLGADTGSPVHHERPQIYLLTKELIKNAAANAHKIYEGTKTVSKFVVFRTTGLGMMGMSVPFAVCGGGLMDITAYLAEQLGQDGEGEAPVIIAAPFTIPADFLYRHGKELFLRERFFLGDDDECSWSSLHDAARHGTVANIHALIEKGCDVNERHYGHTPLDVATQRNVELVRALVDAGADVHSLSDDGKTALFFAAMHSRSDVVQYLLEKGLDATATDHYKDTPLHWSINRGDTKSIELLLEHGADINAVAIAGAPLHKAVWFDQPKALNLLLERGADHSIKGQYGVTPLHMAALRGNVVAVSQLIKRGASVTAKDTFGLTPLHYAASHGGLGFVIDCEDPINYRFTEGSKYYAVADILLRNGAEIKAQGVGRVTPLDAHRRWAIDDQAFISLLVDHGAKEVTAVKAGDLENFECKFDRHLRFSIQYEKWQQSH